MPLKAKCRCGRVLRVKDALAGKRVRCPECQSPVRIPQPQPVPEEFDDDYDEYGEDDPYAAPPPRKKRSRKSSGTKKKSGGGIPLPLIIGGIVLLGLVAVGAGAYFLLSRDSGPAIAGSSNTTPSADSAGASATPPAASEAHAGDSHSASGAADEHGVDSSSAGQTAAAETSSNQAPSSQSAGSSPATDSTPKVWVVLSNFKETTPPGSIGKLYQVDYRIASGAPDPSREYVLYLGSKMGMMERYNEVQINLTSNGTIQIPGGLGASGETRAYVAWKKGRQKWQPVSGEIKVGGSSTAARRPPTVAEAAGAAAQGKMIAVAKPRFEQRLGREALVVDFVLQQPFDHGKRYFLVVRGNGDPVMTDVTTSLMRAKQGEASQFGVRVMGPGGFPSGRLSIQVERRIGLFTRNSEKPEVMSNSVSIQH